MTDTKVLICPYCGDTQPQAERCRQCAGFFDALSRQASHNEMGPWAIRDAGPQNLPGCSYETMVRLVERGVLTKYSIVRGPTTRQFWTVARRTPGVAHLVGYCHACDAGVDPDQHGCPTCGVPFGAYLDRNHLGLPDVRPLPGDAPDGAGPSRAGDGWEPPKMTPLGISSFLAPAASGSPAPNAGANPPAAAPTPRQIEWRDAPEVRLMERRLARQHRTIRGLIGLVIGVAVVGAALNLFTMRRAAGNRPKPAETTPPVNSADAPILLDTASEGTADVASDHAQRSVELPRGDATPDTPAWQQGEPYVVAMKLAASARDVERPIPERIADFERAISALLDLRQDLEAEDHVALDEIVARLELDRERLRLEEIFPSTV